MKKMPKLLALLGLTLSLIVSVPSVAIAKENENIKVGVYTETTDEFPREIFEKVFTNKDIDFLTESLNAKIKYSNDSVKVIIKSKIKTSSETGLTLYADGSPVEVSSEGTIKVPKNTKVISKLNKGSKNNDLGTKAINVTHEEDDFVVSESFFITKIEKTSLNNLNVVFRANSGELLAKMDENEDECTAHKTHNLYSATGHKGYGDKYSVGDWVHCNRFNGQLTDDVHYNWRTGSISEKAASVKNFYASDCHIALIQAGSGCTSKGSCQCNTTKIAAYCSSFVKDANTGIYCPYTYHKHNGLVIPR
ncbi:hypothetical protein [Clostridium sp. FP1]|uniref:hypothetical protein n=1 Tax=Clostridium sp. FP1 TaxID=2724076 RepID=UPI001CCCD59E|nr:hypothetical protein [Clostridium sp. FP1]MBZ9637732.1 hypothetical protein [Clostridium sp. FP1]